MNVLSFAESNLAKSNLTQPSLTESNLARSDLVRCDPGPPESGASAAEAVAGLIARLGTPALPEALDAFLYRVAPFDLSVIFGYPFGRHPLLLHDGYRDRATKAAMEDYLRGAYLLDPFYTASVQGHPAGLWRMRQLSPDQFFESDFYSAAEVHPCISMQPGSLVEEIGFLVPLPAGFVATYSLMRSLGRSPFSDGEIRAFRAVESIVRETIRTHWRDLEKTVAPPRAADTMEAAFATFCADRLTLQQRRIVQLILRGHSSHAIGQMIDVAEGTVKNHRKNIYRRLNISSQSELFALFVRHINGD